jgi:hypothetical protein
MRKNSGYIETIQGGVRFMSVAKINKMKKMDLDHLLYQRGFMPEAFENVKEKRECLIEDLRSEVNA